MDAEERRATKIDLFLIVLIIIFIGILIYGLTIYKADALTCLSNPINYIEQLNNLSCSCEVYKPYLDINFSNIKIKP